VYDELAAVAPKVLPFMDSVWLLLDEKRREGRRILFEGAQARCSTSTTAPIPYCDLIPNTVGSPGGNRLGFGAQRRSAMCSASCKATHAGRAPARFPTNCPRANPIGDGIGQRGPRFGKP
jgi:adenylosuccinate synthase